MNDSGSDGGKVYLLLGLLAHQTEQRFGAQAVGEATWRVTRRRWWRGPRVVWTPLCGLSDGYHGAAGPLLAGLAVDLGRLQEALAGELRGSPR